MLQHFNSTKAILEKLKYSNYGLYLERKGYLRTFKRIKSFTQPYSMSEISLNIYKKVIFENDNEYGGIFLWLWFSKSMAKIVFWKFKNAIFHGDYTKTSMGEIVHKNFSLLIILIFFKMKSYRLDEILNKMC